MPLETRGHLNTVVVLPGAVPVEQICNAVVDRKTLEWICNKYPISVDDVFDCIDYVSDTAKPSTFVRGITFLNSGDAVDFDIETVSVNDTVFFAMISFGHGIKPEALAFDEIYNIGLVQVIKDIYNDLAQDAKYFESSDLHNAVYEALVEEIGDVDPMQILQSLKGDN
jgi:hypothetical protein